MTGDLQACCTRLAADVARLCADYGVQPSEQLLARGQMLLSHADTLLDRHPSYPQHGQLLTAAGWAQLLLACTYHDGGRTQVAEAIRREAAALADELPDRLIGAWAWEIAAWMALTGGEPGAALGAVRAGLVLDAGTGVNAQLHAQAATAHAHLGEIDRAEHETALALDLIARATAADPSGPGHFHVTAARIQLHAMHCRRVLGDDEQTLAAAATVLAASTTSIGEVTGPMPYSEALLTTATILARRGQHTAALDRAETALQVGRRTLPTLLPLAHATSRALHRQHGVDRTRLDALDRRIAALQRRRQAAEPDGE